MCKKQHVAGHQSSHKDLGRGNVRPCEQCEVDPNEFCPGGPTFALRRRSRGWLYEGLRLFNGYKVRRSAQKAVPVQTHGVATRMERPEALKAGNLAKLDLSGVAMICLSSVDLKTPAYIHYAARRLRSRAPHAKLLLGVWSAIDDETLTGLREAVNADYATRSFHGAATIVLEEAAKHPQLRTESLKSEYSARA
jgi:hypothetical protein